MPLHEECKSPCDAECALDTSCDDNASICIVFPVLYIVAFSLWGILASVRLVQFFKYSGGYRWSLKKLLYLFGIITAVLRVIRYIFVITGVAFVNTSLFLIDQYFYVAPLATLFSMYALLIAFWGSILQKKKTPVSWIDTKMKRILIVTTIIVCVSLTVLPITDIFTSVGLLIFNVVIVFIIAGLAGFMIVKGRKVRSMLETFYVGTDKEVVKNREVTTTVTNLVVGSSIGYAISIGVLIAATIARNIEEGFTLCMASHFVYRVLELGMMTLLTYPLRKFGDGTTSTKVTIVSSPNSSTSAVAVL